MREIKFRGMLKHNKEWVYGFFVRDESEFIIYVSRSICTDKETNFYENVSIPEYVIPETVEQYTGLKDKNGKEIFEGDVLKISNTEPYYDPLFTIDSGVEFEAKIVSHSFTWAVEDEDGFIYLELYKLDDEGFDFEVIGNVHEDKQ